MGLIERYTALRQKIWYNKLMRINKEDLERDARPETKTAFDRWTIRHMIGSIPIGMIKPNKSGHMLVSSVAFEVGEAVIARSKPEYSFRTEPLGNKVVDIIFNQIGYEIGSALVNEMFGEEEEEEYWEEEY
nr:MAG: DUF2585 containing protein [uncultured archaeon]